MATAKAARPLPVGTLVDRLWAEREKKRELEAKLKVIQEEIDEQEEALMERLKAEGLDKATGSKASISVTTNTIANVVDWDVFWAYIIKNKYTHLLQRRASDPAYRELLEQGKKVPGVQPFPQRRLNLRTVSS